jgi:Tol biopolymer transport system component
VTSYPGDEREPSLSPDSRQVAFSWDGEDGRRHIYVKLLGEERPLRLTQDPGEDSFPAWSPNGKPSYRQAKRIAWNRLKSLTRPYWAKTP